MSGAPPRPTWIRRHAQRIAALAAIVAIYFATRLPTLADAERSAMSDRFQFTRSVLVNETDLGAAADRRGRPVHPSLEAHRGWISTVGAAVALNDFDADGLPNDVCLIDPRTDRVTISPVPNSGDRYAPFALPVPSGTHDPATIAPMGCIGGDFNEDGWRDLLVYFWGRSPVIHLRRVATPMNVDGYTTVVVGDDSERWFTNAATTADIDGDGHVDLLFGNYFADDARILDPNATGVEEMQDSMSRAFNGGRNRIFLWSANTRDGVTFDEVENAMPEEIARGWALAVGCADLDGDLLPEIYFGHDFGPDRLLHNRSEPGQVRLENLVGRRGLNTPTSKILGRDSFKGMGVDFGDVNGDGHLDIYVSNIAEEFALEESHFLYESTGRIDDMDRGVAPYVDRSEPLGLSRSGWGWDTRLADFDNDGVLEAVQATGFLKGTYDRWPELHELAMGNDTLLRHASAWHRFAEGDDLSGQQHNAFFVRSASGRYFDIAPEIGLDAEHVTRAIATADVDGDGDLDYAIANQWETSYFYRNDRAPHAGASLVLALLLPTAEAGSAPTTVRSGPPAPHTPARPAIGASATVTRPDGRTLVAQVDGGNGHSGARSHELHFGLGAIEATECDVVLRWRDATGTPRQTSVKLVPGWHTIMLGEGDPIMNTADAREGTSDE